MQKSALSVTIAPERDVFAVVWRQRGKVLGAVPIRDLARAEHLKALLDRGVTPADALLRAFRRRRRPKIGATDAVSSKYGRLGAAQRNARLTPERRREIAQQAARSRWGAKEDPAPTPEKVLGDE